MQLETLWQESNLWLALYSLIMQLSYRGQLSSFNRKFLYIYRVFKKREPFEITILS
jgi:hypothetical protein